MLCFKFSMQKTGSLLKNNSLRLTSQHSVRRLSFCSQVATGQHSSPIVFPEKRSKVKTSKRSEISVGIDDLKKSKREEHKIDIGDEKSDLLGYNVFSGKLVLDKAKTSKSNDANTSTDTTNQEIVDAKLTSKALVWGSQLLLLADVVSVSYTFGVRHFTVHSYPVKRTSLAFACFKKSGRSRKDFRFLAATIEEAVQWVSGFADQQCFVNCARHPLVSSKKQASDFLFSDFPLEPYIKCKSPPTMLVILNPRSGHGRSSKVFHGTVEPIFKLAGFNLEVVKTTAAGHARNLAASIDFSTCPDGIICVGGDGIVNEVLNGLLSRDNQKEAISIPIGIIPAGSDNSLVWTVLGVRDPVSAAIAIVKGGLTATDVFAVEWVHTGAIHFGTTVAYFGFISDDMASLPKGFAIGASKKLRARKQAPTKVDPQAKTPPPAATPSPPPKITETPVFDIPEKEEDAPSKRQKIIPDDQSFVLRYLGASSVGDFSEEEVRGWTFRTEQQTEQAMVKAAAELHLHARQSANMAARLRARLAVTDTAKCQAEDKVKSLEKHIALLTQEKDAEIRRLEGERTRLQADKAVLEGNVTAMEKQVDSVITLNSTMQLELDILNDDRLHGWTEEKKLVYQHGFQAGFEEWCSGFIANDPEYTFSKFDADTQIWVNDFRVRAADSIKNKRIFLGLEEEDASPAPLQTQPPPANDQDKTLDAPPA